VGSQREVAKLLKIDKQTISNRERGVTEIDREAELAMRYLAQRKRKP
jgi:transcriptional regulator with XRE-family HTH domain